MGKNVLRRLAALELPDPTTQTGFWQALIVDVPADGPPTAAQTAIHAACTQAGQPYPPAFLILVEVRERGQYARIHSQTTYLVPSANR